METAAGILLLIGIVIVMFLISEVDIRIK